MDRRPSPLSLEKNQAFCQILVFPFRLLPSTHAVHNLQSRSNSDRTKNLMRALDCRSRGSGGRSQAATASFGNLPSFGKMHCTDSILFGIQEACCTCGGNTLPSTAKHCLSAGDSCHRRRRRICIGALASDFRRLPGPLQASTAGPHHW